MQVRKIILFGVGGVGRALIEQILTNRQYHADQYLVDLQLCALCDSSGAMSAPTGLSDAQLREALSLKESGGRLCDHDAGASHSSVKEFAGSFTEPGTIFVDCTATDATVDALVAAIDNDQKVALANKVPLTVQQEVYHRLTRAGITSSTPNSRPNRALRLCQSRWETTVGAGLPVIATLNRLVSSGDEVQRITGTFSGTLGYVMTGLQEGKLLSQIVQEAYDLGYTEPDPREDLGGIDVARKALILARGLGWKLDMDAVQVEGLYPPSMDDLSVDEFLKALPELDDAFQTRVNEAAAQGNVLRYAATVENNECRVMPTVVSADSPLGRLSGTDNLVEFTTQWYSPNPLVIQGRGAGVEATAAGVLSDIIELALP